MQDDKKRNTTIASGHYSITGLSNSAYDPGISRAVLCAGYKGYLDVTINSTNNSIMNTTYGIMYSYNNWSQNLPILSVRTALQ